MPRKHGPLRRRVTAISVLSLHLFTNGEADNIRRSEALDRSYAPRWLRYYFLKNLIVPHDCVELHERCNCTWLNNCHGNVGARKRSDRIEGLPSGEHQKLGPVDALSAT